MHNLTDPAAVPVTGPWSDLRADDVVVVVDAPVEAQLARLTGQRGMARADAEARIAAQATGEQRLAVADHVVRNDGTVAELADRVADLWRVLREMPHPADTST